jgi:RHH-type proline utilization regulon transcriptional repressor/proline dehydrogenase/delta 1-pyrroline-5-carboxylate dehydrogenase
MIFINAKNKQETLFNAIKNAYRADETSCVNLLLIDAQLPAESLERIQTQAAELVHATRLNRKNTGGIDSFLQQYDLSSEEGIALMCLAEALLRIPDTATVDKLISDKLANADWQQHLSLRTPLFVNAATWSLMLTGKLIGQPDVSEKSLGATLKRLLNRTSSTVIRPIIMQGMKIIGKQFVMGTTIDEALTRAKKQEAKGYRYSYDMLGEAARTQADAEKYFQSYTNAITAIGNAAENSGPIQGPGISIKLSALHPRYEYSQRARVLAELTPRLLLLAKQAKTYNIGLTVDAEEADRLELSLEIFAEVFCDPQLAGWEGFGLAVQSYQKRAPYVLDWLNALASEQQRRIMVRLIKGAYWDAEIKQSQVLGLKNYPVFTRKNATDVSFLACAKKLLAHPESFYPQFGTHNAYSVAAIMEMAGARNDYEFQCLHGMGTTLYDNIVGANNHNIPCRIYAPVGSHKDLLGYLVRRLLENGANTSFINRLADETAPLDTIIADPVAKIAKLEFKPHPHIPLPVDIYQPQRKNSPGWDLSDSNTQKKLFTELEKLQTKIWNENSFRTPTHIVSPTNTTEIVGQVQEASAQDVEQALVNATTATQDWAELTVNERACILEKAAELFAEHTPELVSLLNREGGKQILDCLSEIRETIDFCNYYAARARLDLTPTVLTGPTGEFNELRLHPRGVIVCISPWNFPLAIFSGQVLAALVAGNCVIAKPAEQTPLIAELAVSILHAAGVPEAVLQVMPGSGEVVGSKLVADERVHGVMFTGSTQTAQLINQTLAKRTGAITPFIAETGGQNAMLVDSSALPEQVVIDVINSAFNSAGQRCSALRVLFLQEDIADRILTMLIAAMPELTIGDPKLLATDIGPVIDNDALSMLQKHVARMQVEANLLYQMTLPNDTQGHFFAPCVIELNNISALPREVFGPVLHVIRYQADELEQILNDISNTGYGLTLGIHSRIDTTIDFITARMPVGNIYVNRNMIGAVVGVQPFGGEKLSGTGPKAGGPHYLPRLCVERAISVNTTAAGGNTTLVSLNE